VERPHIAAKRRIKKNLSKQESRKRKMEQMRPAKTSKKARKHK